MKNFVALLFIAMSLVANGETQFLSNQVAAIMHLQAQRNGKDGLAPTRIFPNARLESGGRLSLDSVYGTSIERIHHDKVQSAVACPAKWMIHFVDRQGNILPGVQDLGSYLGTSIKIPQRSAAAFIGFEDSAYFDNEGIRHAKSGSTRGCTFSLRLEQGSGGNCYQYLEGQLIDVQRKLDQLARIASIHEYRGQTEFTAKAAAYAIQSELRARLCGTCSKTEVLDIRDLLRDRLDAVRSSFRASPTLPGKPDAFQAFKNMVTAWETFRDSVSDI